MSTRVWGNIVGAFADGAILFPLLAALSLQTDMSAWLLLGSAGVAYIVAGVMFRVPMSVQPLKAVVISALAVGASGSEVRVSGALLGCFCLLMMWTGAYEVLEKIPRHFVHGIQLSLGIILISKGLQLASAGSGSGWGDEAFFLSVALFAVMFFLGYFFRFPSMGIVAFLGLVWAVLFSEPSPGGLAAESVRSSSLIRPGVILGLVLPQMVLTTANSVIATEDVAKRYFGQAAASRVTIKRLFSSIGFGNLLSAAVGGLPFCHGSGGVTAHVRGGATHWASNMIVGVTLISFAIFQLSGGEIVLNFPRILLSSLLAATGAFHIALARPSWADHSKRFSLCAMGIAAALTLNMLWVLAVAGLIDLIRWYTSPPEIIKHET